jgi:hypothetical protein
MRPVERAEAADVQLLDAADGRGASVADEDSVE